MILRPLSAALFLTLLSAAAQEPNDRARKYLDTLLKRPAAGVVFDRFYNAWLDTGTLEDMEKFLRSAADAADAQAPAPMVLAFFYAKQNEHAKAAAEFARALEKNPGSAEAWQQKALAEARLLDLTAALASVEKGLAAQPAKELALELRQLQGRLLARDGRTDEALKVWQQLLASAPDDAALHEDIIELQTAEGLNAEALATAEALLAHTADAYQKVQRRLRTGDLHARMGDRDGAVAAYTQCLDDTGADSWLEKEILAQIEQVFRRDDAIAAFKEHLGALAAKYPQRLSLHRRQARLMAETGAAEEAVAAFQNILTLAPGDRTVREEFISLLAQSKKTTEAIAQLEALMKIAPQEAELAARLAELQHEAGKADAARAAAELFLTKSDQSEAAHLRAAALLERCKQLEPALTLYRRTVEKFPASEGAREALAVALHRTGHKDEAAAAWRALAAGADKSRLGNVARSAAAREEHALAWELLSARAAEFGDDPVFLTQLCDVAARVEKFAEALPHARRLVSLAKDATAMESALTLTVRMAEKAKLSEALLAELAAATTPQELCLRAELLEKAGRRPEAEAALKSVAALAPELAAALQVRLHSARGDEAAAARAMQSLVESPGGQKAVHVQRMVELFIRAGQAGEALRFIPLWKKLSPGAAAPWQREAALHMDAGRTKDALLVLRRAAALFEDNADLKSALAAAYRDDGKYADATRLYTSLYEDAKDMPDKIRLAGELARTAQAAGKMDDLIESFEERRRSNRTSLAPLLSLAEVHKFTDNYEARRTALLEAARIAPENKDLRHEIIRTAEAEGDWDRAIQTLRDMAAADTTGAVQSKLAATLYHAGRESEALQLMASLAASGKVDARGAESLAAALAAAQAWTECVQFLAPLTAQYPGDYRLAYLHAVALEENGDTAPALAAFRRLVSMKDELPGGPLAPPVVRSARSVSASRRSSAMNAILSLCPELNDFQAFSMAQRLAYSYKQRRGSSSFSSSGMSSAAARVVTVVLPSAITEVKAHAIAHLHELTADDDALRSVVTAELEAAGLREAAVWLDFSPSSDGRRSTNPPDLYARHPDSLMLQLLIAAGAAAGSRVPPEMAAELAVKLRATRPELARFVAVSLAASDVPAHRKLFEIAVDEMLPLAADPNSAARTVLTGLASNTVTAQLQGTVPAAAVAMMEKLQPFLTKWHQESADGNRERGVLFYALTGQVMQANDRAALLKLLEEELAFSAAAAQPVAYSYSFGGARSAPGMVGLLGFPFLHTQFPRGVASVMELGGYSHQGNRGRFQLSAAELRPLLPQVKDPVLRLLLAFKTGDETLMAECAPALLTVENPSMTVVLLAAGWLEKQKQYEQAAAMLRKAPQLLSAADRKQFDSVLVWWAVSAIKAAEGKLDAASPLLKDAREAAMRLRSAAGADAEMRKSLADYMETLGLKEEAARFTATAPKLRPQPRGMLPPQRQPEAKDRVAELLKAGRREDAMRILTKELKDAARTWISQSRSEAAYEIVEWKKRVEKLGFAEELLKAADPGATEDVNAMAAWGAALEIFGKPAQAVEHYRKALDRRPKHADYFQLWARALITSDSARASEVFKEADAARMGALEHTMSEAIQEHMDVAGWTAFLEALAGWLRGLEPERLRKDGLSWAVNLLELCPGLENKQPDGAPWPAAASDVALLLTCNLGSCDRAFQKYADYVRTYAKEPDLEALDRLAMQVLDLRLAWLKGGGSIKGPCFYYFYFTNGVSEYNLSPGEWVLKRAVNLQKPEMVREAVLPRLKEAGLADEAALLETMTQLHFCPDAEFAAAALAAVQGHAEKRDQAALWSRVMAVRAKRKLDVDLSEPLLAALKVTLEKMAQGQASSEDFHQTMQAWCLSLRRRQGVKEMEAFLRQAAVLYLGPEPERAALFAKEYRPYGNSSNTINGRLHSWRKMIMEMAMEPEISLPVMSRMETEFLPYCKTPAEGLGSQTIGGILYRADFLSRPAEEIMLAWRGTPALAVVAEFDLPLILTKLGGAMPVTIFNCLRLKENVAKMRAAFAAEPATFGTAFMQAALADQPSDALLSLLGENVAALEQLPLARQQRIAAIFYAASVAERKAQSAAIAKGKTWLEQVEGKAALAGVEKFMAAGKASEVKASDQDYGRAVLETLAMLLPTDPEHALRYFLKARGQVAADRKAGTQSVRSDGGQSEDMKRSVSVLGAALGGALQRMEPGIPAGDARLPRMIAAVAEMLAADSGCGMESSQSVGTFLGWMLRKAGTPGGKDGVFTVQRLVETIGPVVKPGWLPALQVPVRSVMWTTSMRSSAESQAWLEVQAKDGAHREFAMLLLAAARIGSQELSTANKPRAGLMLREQLPAEQQWLIAVLEKKSVPPAMLASCAAEIIRDWPAAEPPLRYACAQALAAAWAADAPVNEQEADRIVESLTLLSTNHVLPQDEGFTAAAKALAQAWVTRLERKFGDRAAVYGWPATGLHDRLLLRRMFYLALGAGHTAEGAKLAALMEENDGAWLTPAWLGIAVQFRQFELAKRMLKQSPSRFYNYDPDGRNIGWDYKVDTHEGLAGLRALYENLAERYRAEIILSSLPDIESEGVGGPLKGKAEPRDGRLLALAKAWPGDDVLKLPDAMSLLARLLAVPGGDVALAPVLERIGKGKALTDYLPGDNPKDETYGTGRMIGALMKQRLAAGDAETLLTFCQAVLQTKRNNSVPSGNAGVVAAVWLEALVAMKPQWPKWDEATRKKVRATGGDLLCDEGVRSALSNVENNEAVTCFVHLYWLALAAEEMNEFDATIGSALKDATPWIQSGIQQLDVEKMLHSLLQPWPAEAPEAAQKRSELMLQWILSGDELPGHAVDGDQWFRRVIKAGWLRPEDVLAKAEELIAKRGRGGVTAPELLEIAVAAKRDDVAAKIRELIKAAATPSGKPDGP